MRRPAGDQSAPLGRRAAPLQKDEDDEHDEGDGPTVPLYVKDPDATVGGRDYKLRRDGENLVYEDTTFVATILPDGQLQFRDRNRPKPRYDRSECASVGVDGAFDLTDLAMRAHGEDPYAYEKRRFARHTASMRSAMRKRHLRRVGKQALAELPMRLSRIWRLYRNRPSRLRRLLFELWDECAERRGQRDRRREARLGVAARRIITRYINAQLPSGTAMAYQRTELRRLNRARRSRARFRPYDDE